MKTLLAIMIATALALGTGANADAGIRALLGDKIGLAPTASTAARLVQNDCQAKAEALRASYGPQAVLLSWQPTSAGCRVKILAPGDGSNPRIVVKVIK